MTRSLLNLKKAPRYMEGMDISNIRGELAVGTIVSFEDGSPAGRDIAITG